jgi:hypothetical protein
MSKATILIQAQGRSVPQEDGSPWPDAGLPDPGTLYVRRRIKDGDLIPATPTRPSKAEGDK